MTNLSSKLTAAATAILLSTIVPSCSAQAWAKAALDKSPRHGEFVTITEASGRKLQAWVVYPEVKDKAPVVVMIHEIFGLSDWAREMADEVAAEGYIVVEPDLLSGFGAPAGARQGCARRGDGPHEHAGFSERFRSCVCPRFARRNSGFSGPERSDEGGFGARSRAGHSRPRRRGRLRQEAARRERQALRRWLLLGRRKVLPLRDAPQRPERGVCLLRSACANRCVEEHHRSGLRLLCGERCAHHA